jgi:hypothetical protein
MTKSTILLSSNSIVANSEIREIQKSRNPWIIQDIGSLIVFSTGMNPLADTHEMWLVIILWKMFSNLRNLTPSKMIDCQLQLLQVRACAERQLVAEMLCNGLPGGSYCR